MKSAGNVVGIRAKADAGTLGGPPKHMRKAVQKQAWNDLVSKAGPEVAIQDRYFEFEMAATLLAKFRGGAAMTATETKSLQAALVRLGFSVGDAAPAKAKKKPGEEYFA